MNYKTTDTHRVLYYIDSSTTPIPVEDILLHSGAHKLRVYPALFELEQSGYLEVVEREELGAPLVVCRRRDSSMKPE